MGAHLLPLAALHAAAPGVLDVIFGPDGDFEGAPKWRPPLWGHLPNEFKRQARHHQMAGLSVWVVSEMPRPLVRLPSGNTASIHDAALDLRVPSVAARLAGLCARAGYPDLSFQDNEVIAQARYGGPSWNEAWAVRLAALTLALAPRIAAFRP